MLVGRMLFNQGKLTKVDEPFEIYSTAPMIVVLDQSSSATGVTIGSPEEGIKEVMVFEREKNKKETIGNYLNEMEKWLRKLLSKMNVLEFTCEQWFTSGYHESDRIMKEVYGKIVHIHNTATCLDKDGNEVLLKNHATHFQPINNNSWKSVVVPSSYFKHYKDPTDAYVSYASKIFPAMATAGGDCCASFLMYLYLMKTKYGNTKLVPDKAQVETTHTLILHAFPFRPVNLTNPKFLELSDDGLSSKKNSKQELFETKYNKQIAKRFLGIMMNQQTETDMIIEDKEQIDSIIGLYLRSLPKETLTADIKTLESLNYDLSRVNLQEIEMSDKLNIEEMFRAFTGKSKNIFYMIVEPSLHYNYLISNFRIQLQSNQKIMVVGMKY